MSIIHGFAHTFAITPSDTVDVARPCEGLLVCAAGNLVFDDADSNTITITAATAGTHIMVKVQRVRATGTTATVIGLWGA